VELASTKQVEKWERNKGKKKKQQQQNKPTLHHVENKIYSTTLVAIRKQQNPDFAKVITTMQPYTTLNSHAKRE